MKVKVYYYIPQTVEIEVKDKFANLEGTTLTIGMDDSKLWKLKQELEKTVNDFIPKDAKIIGIINQSNDADIWDGELD